MSDERLTAEQIEELITMWSVQRTRWHANTTLAERVVRELKAARQEIAQLQEALEDAEEHIEGMSGTIYRGDAS